jgi:hypothetical protein
MNGRSRKAGLVAGLVLALSWPAAATAQQSQRPSCERLEAHRAFDFWVGTWDVVVNDSTQAPAGTNTISPIHNGCLLTEQWESVSGGTGSSVNFYDAARGVWRQIWVAPAYVVDIEGGVDEDGAMVLEGELRTFVTKTVSPFRGTWALLEEGVVNQRFEIQDPETGQWSVWFDGLYRKRR